jgi:hypothetical protein
MTTFAGANAISGDTRIETGCFAPVTVVAVSIIPTTTYRVFIAFSLRTTQRPRCAHGVGSATRMP